MMETSFRHGWTVALILAMSIVPLTRAGGGNGRLDIHWTDVEGGAATLIVSPTGESVLVDTGMPGERDPARIHRTLQTAGVARLDHLVVTHFDIDHYGGTADLARLVEIDRVWDPGLPTDSPGLMERIEPYLEATRGRRTVLRPGDDIPLRSPATGSAVAPRLRCLAAAQSFVDPTPDQERPNPHCDEHRPKGRDTSRNANSVVLLLEFGPFRFFDGADLTWDLEHRLVCPHNLVGAVDVFQIDHHGLPQSNNPVLVRSLEPRVVIMNNGPRKGCHPEVYATIRKTPSVDAVYQLHRNIGSGPEGNTLPRRIANVHADCEGRGISLSVSPDGKTYDVLIPDRGLVESYRTRG